MFINVHFLALSKNIFLLCKCMKINRDREEALREKLPDNIFIERKDDVLLSFKQIFNC